MEALDCITTRRSIRKFQNKKIPFDFIAKIIDAGRLAPSAGNLQNWKFIVVNDLAKRQAIAQACLKQTWISKAPVIIVICSEPVKVERYYGTRGEKLYSIQNCAAAAENILLAAHSLGLGACWVGAFDEEMVAKALGIRDGARPQICIPIGYPDETPAEHLKFPIERVFYFNRWRGTIENVPLYFEYFGPTIQKAAKATKELAEKGAKLAAQKTKELADRISQKIKQKKFI